MAAAKSSGSSKLGMLMGICCRQPELLKNKTNKMVFSVQEHIYIRTHPRGEGGGVLPHMGYVGMCHCEGYGFQAVYSGIGYLNQSVWV